MAVPITAAALSHLVMAWMLTLSPPDRDAARPTYPEAQEDAYERRERYERIAEDVSEALLDLAPPRRRGAAELLVAIAWHESGFAKDVDLGPCAPGRLKIGGCDSGRARGLWQVQAYDWGHRREAAMLALRLAYRSMTACKKLPVEERLAVYAAGTCGSLQGQRRSREIWTVLRRIRAIPDPAPLDG